MAVWKLGNLSVNPWCLFLKIVDSNVKCHLYIKGAMPFCFHLIQSYIVCSFLVGSRRSYFVQTNQCLTYPCTEYWLKEYADWRVLVPIFQSLFFCLWHWKTTSPFLIQSADLFCGKTVVNEHDTFELLEKKKELWAAIQRSTNAQVWSFKIKQ